MEYLERKHGIKLSYYQVYTVIEAFFILSFEWLMHGRNPLWNKSRVFKLSIIKYIAKPQMRAGRFSPVICAENFPGYEFTFYIGGKYIDREGYDFWPDMMVRKMIASYLDKYPSVGHKLLESCSIKE